MNINSMSKLELEAYAREEHGVELDRRLSKTKLLKQVKQLDDDAENLKQADVMIDAIIDERDKLPESEKVSTVIEAVVPEKAITVTHVDDESRKALKRIVVAYELWISRNRDRNSYRELAESIIDAKKLI